MLHLDVITQMLHVGLAEVGIPAAACQMAAYASPLCNKTHCRNLEPQPMTNVFLLYDKDSAAHRSPLSSSFCLSYSSSSCVSVAYSAARKTTH